MSLESTATDSTGFRFANMNVGGPTYAVLCKKVSKSRLKKNRVKATFLGKQRCVFNEHETARKQTGYLGAKNKTHVIFGNFPP